MPFNPLYPIPAASSRTQMRYLKQQLPFDLFLPHSLALSFLSGSVVLTHSLSRTATVCELWLFPLPLISLLPLLWHSHPFLRRNHMEKKKDGWCTSRDGCQMWNVTQQSYITLGTHTYSPPAATPTRSRKQMGIPAKSGDSPKVWPSFLRGTGYKTVSGVSFKKEQLAHWAGFVLRLGHNNRIWEV